LSKETANGTLNGCEKKIESGCRSFGIVTFTQLCGLHSLKASRPGLSAGREGGKLSAGHIPIQVEIELVEIYGVYGDDIQPRGSISIDLSRYRCIDGAVLHPHLARTQELIIFLEEG